MGLIKTRGVMKYTIEGFSQEMLLSFGCDTQDAVFLRWFVDWQNTGQMEEIQGKDGLTYYWVNLPYCLQQIPILHITCTAALSRRIKRLEKVKLLKTKLIKKQSQSKIFIAIIPESFRLLVMKNDNVQNSKVRCEKLKSTLSNNNGNGESQSTHDLKVRCEKKGNGISQVTQKYANSSINKEILLSGSKKREREEAHALASPTSSVIIERGEVQVFGEFLNVSLSDGEMVKLSEFLNVSFPTLNGNCHAALQEYIEAMSAWQISKNVSLKNHYAEIRRWILHDKQKGIIPGAGVVSPPTKSKKTSSYEDDMLLLASL